jgi:hypothetical protein
MNYFDTGFFEKSPVIGCSVQAHKSVDFTTLMFIEPFYRVRKCKKSNQLDFVGEEFCQFLLCNKWADFKRLPTHQTFH